MVYHPCLGGDISHILQTSSNDYKRDNRSPQGFGCGAYFALTGVLQLPGRISR